MMHRLGGAPRRPRRERGQHHVLPVSLDQRLEVRDASGATVGFILSDQQTRDLLADPGRPAQTGGRVAGANRPADGGAGRVPRILALPGPQGLTPLTEQELAELQKDGLPFEQLLPEIEQIVGLKAAGE